MSQPEKRKVPPTGLPNPQPQNDPGEVKLPKDQVQTTTTTKRDTKVAT